MYYRESFQIMEGRDLQGLKSMPKWAREEHMERSVPLKELWRYSGSSSKKEKPHRDRYFQYNKEVRKMKRKHEMICHSAEEMNRRADALIEQGFQVEREAGVLPVQALCFPIYKIIFWK